MDDGGEPVVAGELAVGGESAVAGEPVVAGEPAVGGESAVDGEPVVAGEPAVGGESVPPSETLWPSPGPWTPPFNYTWVPLFHPNETRWIRNDQIILVGVLQYKDKYTCNIALAQKVTQLVIANIAEFLW